LRLIIITLLLLIALFAPWLAPLDPNWQDAAAACRVRARGTGSAPTATAAIFSQG
jgi:ABC-type dipeptide/oligopeptide/nickel transport system permease subunit